MTKICGIILAAGESKRMGSPKMLLPYKGKTIIETVIANVTSSNVDSTLVVLGAVRDEILKKISYMAVKHCFNENYINGMLSSVICGFSSLPYGFDAAMIFLGDQPMVETSVINHIIDEYHNSGKGILIPVYEKKRGHPLMIDKKYLAEIVNLNQDEGLRSLAQKFHKDVLEIEVNTLSILKDIDTFEEYTNELK